MSTKPNHRRGTPRLQDHGSTWEGEPNDGGARVRMGRRRWKRAANRTERRTGQRSKKMHRPGRPQPRPEE